MTTLNFVLSNWTYKEYNEFVSLYAQRNFRQAGHLAEKIVADWSPFGISADVEHPIDHLSFEDSAAVLLAIQVKTKEYVESLDYESDVIIDLSKWKWNDFNRFSDVVETGKVDVALEMLRGVCRLKKGNPKASEELNAVQGMAMMAALTDKIKRVFSGGN